MDEIWEKQGNKAIQQRIDELIDQLNHHETTHKIFTTKEVIEIKNKIKLLNILLIA